LKVENRSTSVINQSIITQRNTATAAASWATWQN